MLRLLPILAVLVTLPFSANAASDVAVVDVTYETCAQGTAAVVRGEACHVQEIANGGSKWEMTLKFGLNFEATASVGTGVGAGASTAFVVKLTIPGSRARTADEARDYILKKNAEELAKAIAAALKTKVGTAKMPPEKQILRVLKDEAKPYCSLTDEDFDELLRKNSCSLDD